MDSQNDKCAPEAPQKTKTTNPLKSANNNENNISINLCTSLEKSSPSFTSAASKQDETLAITLQPAPINLNIKTETDWPTVIVSLSSSIIAIVVAYFGHKTQKNQVRANISTIRAKWIEDLRETAAKFIEIVALMINKTRIEKTWITSSESTEQYSSLLYTQVKLSLMLDKTKRTNKQTIELSEAIILIIQNSKEGNQDYEKLHNDLEIFEKNMSIILEDAWQDIKLDLNPTLWGQIKRQIKSEQERNSRSPT